MRVLVHHLAQRMGMPERSAPGGGAPGSMFPPLILIRLHDGGPGCPPPCIVDSCFRGTRGAPRVHEPMQNSWFCGYAGGTRQSCARVPPFTSIGRF